MSSQQTSVDLTAKIKDLEEENELLLLQLHQVQEELESYFLKCKDLEARSEGLGGNSNFAWVDDALPEALAEIERLKTLAKVQCEIRSIENQNALNVKLGNMVLKASGSAGGVAKLPFALMQFWRHATSKSVPPSLGGKDFGLVIKAYDESGFQGVEKLLQTVESAMVMKANAYTAVARYLIKKNAAAAADAAEKAFELDPKPYRLKWLACRLHESNDLLRADAIIDLLPQGLTYSESEQRQIDQIRNEAKNLRRKDAHKKSQINSRQEEIKRNINQLTSQVKTLTAARDQATQKVGELEAQLEVASREKAAFAEERATLTAARDEQAKLAIERGAQITVFNAERLQLAKIESHVPDRSWLEAMLTAQQSALEKSQMDIAKGFASALENHINAKLSVNEQNLKEVAAALSQKLEMTAQNSMKQVESYISIQNFLGADSLIFDFHGWPISPDLALFILDRMQEEQYDLIIEFGSGTSTAVLAQAVSVLGQRRADKLTENLDVNLSHQKQTTIVSFEHDKFYYGKTLRMLETRNLNQRVRLVHAPLVDWQEGDKNYLYYDCESTLVQLAHEYQNRNLRILLLVDGPPTSTCLDARYPAVPLVFNTFGRHQIDVVLDDASRAKEMQVIDLWNKFWNRRSIRMCDQKMNSEKGIFFATSLNNII